MSTELSTGFIIGLCFATCCAPLIIYQAGCFAGCWCCGTNWGYYSIYIDDSKRCDFQVFCWLIPCSCFIGILCMIIFLILIYETSLSLSIMYVLFFFIIPVGFIIICWIIYGLHGLKYLKHIKEGKLDKEIQSKLELTRHDGWGWYHNGHRQYEVLIMGNNTGFTQKLLNHLILKLAEDQHRENDYYKELMIKYMIKYLKSLLIITIKKYDYKQKGILYDDFNAIFAFSTFGIHQTFKPINDPQIVDKIMKVWNNQHVQNIFAQISSIINDKKSADDKENFVGSNFLNHFLNKKDLKTFLNEEIVDNEDIDVILKEQQYYDNNLCFGQCECQVPKTDKYLNTFNFRFYESQKGIKMVEDEKWLKYAVTSYSLSCILYIVDFSMFGNGNIEFIHIIKYWSFECFGDDHYIPFEVETLITKYMTNSCFLNDIERLQYIVNLHDIDKLRSIIILFCNVDKYFDFIEKYGINGLRLFFPDEAFDELQMINNRGNYECLEPIMNLWKGSNYNNDERHIMNGLNDMHNKKYLKLLVIWSDIHHCIITNSLCYGGIL